MSKLPTIIREGDVMWHANPSYMDAPIRVRVVCKQLSNFWEVRHEDKEVVHRRPHKDTFQVRAQFLFPSLEAVVAAVRENAEFQIGEANSVIMKYKFILDQHEAFQKEQEAKGQK